MEIGESREGANKQRERAQTNDKEREDGGGFEVDRRCPHDNVYAVPPIRYYKKYTSQNDITTSDIALCILRDSLRADDLTTIHSTTCRGMEGQNGTVYLCPHR